MPVHLRWELYPIAHCAERKSGGSYLEKVGWWRKTHRRSLTGKLAYTASEILFFTKCRRYNAGLWYFSYPFHIGLFLMVAWLLLIVVGSLTIIAGVPHEPLTVWAKAAYFLTLATGVPGLFLCCIGSLALLVKRSIDRDLRPFTSPVEYLNLLLILAVAASGLVSWAVFDNTFHDTRLFVANIIAFHSLGSVNWALSCTTALFCLFLIYLPFSRMMHGPAKYFAYRKVAWDDEQMLRGTKLEKNADPMEQGNLLACPALYSNSILKCS